MGVHENNIRQALVELDCSTTFLSALAALEKVPGSSNARLSAAFAGQSLGGETVLGLSKLIKDLKDFSAELKGIPVKLKDADQIKPLLDAWRNGDLKILIVSSQSPDAYTVGFAGGYFAGSAKPQDVGLVLTRDVAEEIASSLRDRGYDGVSVRQSQSTGPVVDAVEKAWSSR